MRTAGIRRHVASNRRRLLGCRVRREMQATVGECVRKVEVDHTGTDPRRASDLVDLVYLVHPGEHDENRTRGRDRTARKTGPGPPSDNRHVRTSGDLHDRYNLIGGLRQNDDGRISRAHAGILGIDHPVDRLGVNALSSKNFGQSSGHVHGGSVVNGPGASAAGETETVVDPNHDEPSESRRRPGPGTRTLASKTDMAVHVSNTPNPNALKFTVGVDVGGPATFVAGRETDDANAAAILAIDGVTSVFMTADFVTLSKSPESSWEMIAPQATALLEERFGV